MDKFRDSLPDWLLDSNYRFAMPIAVVITTLMYWAVDWLFGVAGLVVFALLGVAYTVYFKRKNGYDLDWD